MEVKKGKVGTLLSFLLGKLEVDKNRVPRVFGVVYHS